MKLYIVMDLISLNFIAFFRQHININIIDLYINDTIKNDFFTEQLTRKLI